MIDLGSLYTRIEADTSGLNKSLGAIKKFAKVSAGVLAGITAAGVGVGGAAAAIVNSVAKQTKEMSNLANAAGLDTGSLQAYAFATETVGINAEKLADISKDVFDKIGDYAATGGGEMKDFFENIGNAAGLTAEKLLKMSGPEALGAMKNAMDAANISAKQQVFYMEGIANDASYLIPLLAENGKQMKQLADRGRELGVSLSEIEVENLKKAATATKELGATFEVLKQRVAAGLAPIYTWIVEKLTVGMENFNKTVSSGAITEWAKESGTAILDFASIFITAFDAVYRSINAVIGSAKMVYAGIFKIVQGVTYLGLQVAKLTGNEKEIQDWSAGYQAATEIIENSVSDASEAFSRMQDGLPYADEAKNKIEKLKNELSAIDSKTKTAENIEKNITKPIREIATKSYPKLDKGFKDIWEEGGKVAEDNLKNVDSQLDQIYDNIDRIYNKYKDLSNIDLVTPQARAGYSLGGVIQKMKDGGSVIKAAAGRYFPGFGGGDKIPILGEAGEFMINKFANRAAGTDTTRAYNNQDWGTVVSNLFQKMSSGGPTSPAFALAGGGSVVSNQQPSETPRIYNIPGMGSISVRSDEVNAQKMLRAFKKLHSGRS
jgi:hypothetical protein